MAGDAVSTRPNGAGAATIVAAAFGCFALGVLAFVGDAFPGIAHLLNIWNPTGPLSGVTDGAIALWLIVWFALSRRWNARDVDMHGFNILSALLLIGGLLLTFPPFMDLLQGK